MGIVLPMAQYRAEILHIGHTNRIPDDGDPNVAHRDTSAEILCRAKKIAVFQAAHDHRRVGMDTFPRRLSGQSG